MDIDLETLTLAALLTTAGALSLATIVVGIVAVIGRLFVLEGNESKAAAVLAWYSVTRLAMSIHDDAANKPRSLRNQT